MRTMRLLLLTAFGLGLAGCTEPSAPTAPRPEAGLLDPGLGLTSTEIHPLRWQAATGSRFTYRVAELGDTFAPATDGQASFWAVRGQSRTLEVNYSGADGTWHPYFVFSVPSDALYRRPDGTLVAYGDSVRISVGLDTVQLVLHMEPTGLRFNPWHPAHVRWWYRGANPDYNNDGAVNLADLLLEETELGVQVQEALDAPWQLLNASLTLTDKRFDLDLKHFSGYAVAW